MYLYLCLFSNMERYGKNFPSFRFNRVGLKLIAFKRRLREFVLVHISMINLLFRFLKIENDEHWRSGVYIHSYTPYVFTLNCKFSWFLSDTNWSFFCYQKKRIEEYSSRLKHLFWELFTSHYGDLKKTWFWRFFAFPRKTSDIFMHDFSKYYIMILAFN